ncbi:RsmD family RNA methyltransferase [Halobacteriovorax sp. GB3]|uniref:RsmD family RNA methyltransferase n=1 Tax=Halobacteriovorax sp. GB3 TaxID=2719615 RepID=UPI002360C455|nr:RsmD family RNA methyltransferase [Halobacteriovorax sp. GB3]MDD0853807.1 RsmD family RNA methyltransferase [Halobacteriovorax sp. GB3]
MAIKILGGKAKGLALEVPKGDEVRPTSVMLRRKIFDAHQDLSGVHFIDLCAGTGAMGAEALSRGANSVMCIEGNKKVSNYLKRNFSSLERSGLDLEKVLIQTQKAEKWISQFELLYSHWEVERKLNTVIFFDPPYELKGLYKLIIEEVLEKHWFIGELWLESDEQKGVKQKDLLDLTIMEAKKFYRQGTSYIALYDCSSRA